LLTVKHPKIGNECCWSILLAPPNSEARILSNSYHVTPIEFCLKNRTLIIASMALCALLALGYAAGMKKRWRASQTMVLRDDLLGQSFKPGRFPSQETLKNAQETLLHIAKKSSVIREALRESYPEKAVLESWPSNTLIDETRELISLLAPNGSDFGKTDVVVLSVYQYTPETARQFAEKLSNQIEIHLRLFRSDLLRSMERELQLQYEQAQAEFDDVAAPVRGLVEAAGVDLESLRSFKDTQGSFELQRILESLKSDKRRYQTELQTARKQLEFLREARANPEQAFVSNNELVQLQHSLKKLTDGLNEAKVVYNNLAGPLLPEHPQLRGARQAIENQKQQIFDEIDLIEASLLTQIELAQSQIDFFQAEEEKYERRMLSINARRVDFQQLTNDLSQRLEALSKLQTSLSEIQSLASTADRVSLVSIVGLPEVGTKPKGVSRAAVVLLGAFGGGLFGLGLAVLKQDPKWGPACQKWTSTIKDQIGKITYGPLASLKVSPPEPIKPSVPVRQFGSGTVRPATRPSEIIKWSDEDVFQSGKTSSDPVPVVPMDFAENAGTPHVKKSEEIAFYETANVADSFPESLWQPEHNSDSQQTSSKPSGLHSIAPIKFEDALAEATTEWEGPGAFSPPLHSPAWNFSINDDEDSEAEYQTTSGNHVVEPTADEVADSTSEDEEERLARKQQELQDRLSRLTSSIKSHGS
jgi:polysaccharide biosynthesis transport protein